MEILSRISTDPQVRFGKPCVRGTRITVGEVLGHLADGRTEAELLPNWGFWGSGEPMRAKKRLRRNEGVAFSMEAVKPDEVVQLANRMSAAARMVYELRRRYIEQRHVLLRSLAIDEAVAWIADTWVLRRATRSKLNRC